MFGLVLAVLQNLFIPLPLPEQEQVWISTRRLPAYHLILDTDVIQQQVKVSELPPQMTPVAISPAGAFVQRPLEEQQPIGDDEIIRTELDWQDAQIITLPTSPALASGHLEVGMTPYLWTLETDGKPVQLSKVLVLDTFPLLVLAVPFDHLDAVLPHRFENTLFFSFAKD